MVAGFPQTKMPQNHCIDLIILDERNYQYLVFYHYGLPLVVDDRFDDPLLEIRTMIFAKASSADRFPAAAFELNRGGIKEHEVQAHKKIPAMPEDMLFNQVFGSRGTFYDLML